MIQHFIATETFTHQIKCFCPGNIHSTSITIYKMDILEIHEQMTTFNNGWYVQAVLNGYGCFYIALEDIDQYFQQGKFASTLDLDLHINFLQLQIDQALEKRNERLFFKGTEQLKKATVFKMQLESFIHNTIGNYYYP